MHTDPLLFQNHIDRNPSAARKSSKENPAGAGNARLYSSCANPSSSKKQPIPEEPSTPAGSPRQPKRKRRLSKKEIKRRKRKRFFRKVLRVCLAIVLIIVLFLGAGGVYVYNKVCAYMDQITFTALEASDEELYISDQAAELSAKHHITNIAVFGLDKRSENEASRSDTILILSINEKTGEMRVASIMRDTFVSIPGHDMQKINAAYALGGAKLAVQTLNYNFDLDIRDYITVDFAALAALVDSIGGLEVNIRDVEIENMNTVIKENARLLNQEATYITNAGTQDLNGLQALAYCRIRSTDNSDFTRTSRQRIVFAKVLDKIKTQKNLKMALTLLKDFSAHLTTSLDKAAIISNVLLLRHDTFAVETVNFLTDDTIRAGYMDGVMYVLPYYLKTQVKNLHTALYDIESYTPSKQALEADSKIQNRYQDFYIEEISSAAVVE